MDLGHSSKSSNLCKFWGYIFLIDCLSFFFHFHIHLTAYNWHFSNQWKIFCKFFPKKYFRFLLLNQMTRYKICGWVGSSSSGHGFFSFCSFCSFFFKPNFRVPWSLGIQKLGRLTVLGMHVQAFVCVFLNPIFSTFSQILLKRRKLFFPLFEQNEFLQNKRPFFLCVCFFC